MKKKVPILQLYTHPAAGPKTIFFKGGPIPTEINIASTLCIICRPQASQHDEQIRSHPELRLSRMAFGGVGLSLAGEGGSKGYHWPDNLDRGVA